MSPYTARIALIGAASCMAIAGTGTATRAASAGATCHGLPVTVAGRSGVVVGTSHRDIIRLDAPALVLAGAGDDVICGSAGSDVIDAGRGGDVVVGRGGSDRIRGGAGRDVLFGDSGNDRIAGGLGRDVVMGGAGRDVRLRPSPIAVAGEREVAAGPDASVPGLRGISLIVDADGLSSLRSTGRRIAAAWEDPLGQDPYIATAVLPLESGAALAFTYPYTFAARGALGPGTVISPWVIGIPAQQGDGSTFQQLEPGFINVIPGPRRAGAITAVYANFTEPAIGGLGRRSSIDGVPEPWASVVSARAIPLSGFGSTFTLSLTLPSRLHLFLAPDATEPGTVFPGAPVQPTITVDISPTQVVAVSYSAEKGFRSDVAG